MPHQRAAVKCAHRREADLAVGELQHLQRFWKLQQLGDVVGDQLFRADRHVHGEIFARKDFRVGQIIRRADARDLGRRVEQGRGELARHHIGFVALRDREQQIGVFQARLRQYCRMRRVAAYGAHIEAILQPAQAIRVGIDNGDVVGLRREIFRDG